MWVARLRVTKKVKHLPRLLVVENLKSASSQSFQRFIVHAQTGLENLPTERSAARDALLAGSKSSSVYCSGTVMFESGGKCAERCLVANVTAQSVVCVTLVKPDTFLQVRSTHLHLYSDLPP
jgi:hypothetical protein